MTVLANALEAVTLTDTGKVRTHNEDAVFADAASGVAILADGMGGCNAGEVASGMAVLLLSKALQHDFAAGLLHGCQPDENARVERAVIDRVAMANTAIFEASSKEAAYDGMGTTLVTTVFHNNHVTVAHLGDSRLYRLRDGELYIMTRDHSLLQEQIDAGLVVLDQGNLYDKSLVTRALGVDLFVNTECHTYDARRGDIYLLCSDGLNDMVEGHDIRQALKSSADIDRMAARLVQMANDNGGYDNVSVVIVRILREFPALENPRDAASDRNTSKGQSSIR